MADQLAPATDSTLVGTALVIDGDTLAITGQRIRLLGIDAPESHPTGLAGGRRLLCWRQGTQALDDQDKGGAVWCGGDDTDGLRSG